MKLAGATVQRVSRQSSRIDSKFSLTVRRVRLPARPLKSP